MFGIVAVFTNTTKPTPFIFCIQDLRLQTADLFGLCLKSKMFSNVLRFQMPQTNRAGTFARRFSRNRSTIISPAIP